MNKDQLKNSLDRYFVEVIKILGGENTIRTSAKRWLKSKSENYQGKEYEEQLQRNSIYFVEATASTKIGIIDYLNSNQPINISSNQIPSYVEYVGKTRPLEFTKSINSYINGYIDELPQQISNFDWSRFRSIKGKNANYIKELETTCVLYRISSGLSDSVLQLMLYNPNLGGCSRSIVYYELFTLITMSVNYWANFVIDESKLETKPKAPKGWRLFRK